MLINWFTVGAQIVNFLILVVLLKIFLYDRIISAMDSREENIRSRLEEAEKQKSEADSRLREYQEKKEQLEQERKETLSRAKTEAEERKKELMHRFKAESEKQRKKWRESVEKDKQEFLNRLRHMTNRQVYAVAEKTLTVLMDADLEKELVRTFQNRLAAAKGDRLDQMAAAAEKEGLTIFSGFEMASADRSSMTRKIHELLGEDISVDYETDTDLSLDIKLKTAGYRFSWGINDYLDRLEASVKDALEEAGGRPDTDETQTDETSGEADHDGKQQA